MNNLKNCAVLALSLLMFISLTVLAQETQKRPPEPVAAAVKPDAKTPATTTTSQASSQTDNGAAATQQATQTPPPVNSANANPIKPFNPTEKVEADSAVAFPVDI